MTALHQASARHSDPLIGTLLDGRYQIHQPIGKGGMGTVYSAEHVLLRRKLAVKTLHPALTSTPEVIERFHREAVAASSIGSEHIVSVTDMGRLESGTCYIVMEYLEGADVGWCVSTEGSLSVSRTRHIGMQLCKALGAVHAAGIVHRDLKPENLFLTTRDGDSDFLKILDFGICKFRDLAAHSYARLTATAVALGTPHFMAPEQIEGSRLLDHRADLYAVGANLYYMLTGATPFDAGSVPGLFHRICLEPAPDVRVSRSDVPAAFAEILERALAKSPDARFAHASELYDALAALELPQDDDATRKARFLQSSIRRTAERSSTVPNPRRSGPDDDDDAEKRVTRTASASNVDLSIAAAGRPTQLQRAIRLAIASVLLIIAAYAVADSAASRGSSHAHGRTVVRPAPLQPTAAETSRLSALDDTRAEPSSAPPARAPEAPVKPAARDNTPPRVHARRVASAPAEPTALQLPAAEPPEPSDHVAEPTPVPAAAAPTETRTVPDRTRDRRPAYQPSARDIIHVFDQPAD